MTLLPFLITSLFIQANNSKLTEIVKFATINEAKELLLQEDKFTQSWSPFDIDSRMQKKNSSKEELLELIVTQAKAWTTEEKEIISTILKEIDDLIKKQNFHISFPESLYFIKTTTLEEGSAQGYTRSNYIILNEKLALKDREDLKGTIIHELFHILTRANPEFRKELYSIIGFEIMKEIDYPQKLKPFRITNPDAPQTDSYISLKVDGQPVDCMMILYATENYDGGDFFKYLNIGFLALTDDTIKKAKLDGDTPIVYSMKDVSGFAEQVGTNTQYIIHPEEILAENFKLALLNVKDLPNPEITEAIQEKLRK